MIINQASLKKVCDDVVVDPELKPHIDSDGKVIETFCNLATNIISVRLGYDCFSNMNATQIIQWLQKNGLILTPDMAVEAALQGRWVIAGWLNPDPTGHSHVCTIYPAEMQISTTYGGPVPMVANVGESNGIMRLSGAFAKIREPLLYLV